MNTKLLSIESPTTWNLLPGKSGLISFAGEDRAVKLQSHIAIFPQFVRRNVLSRLTRGGQHQLNPRCARKGAARTALASKPTIVQPAVLAAFASGQ
jgi:hypothetical protein